MAVERFVQGHGVDRDAIRIVPVSAENSAGVEVAGADAKRGSLHRHQAMRQHSPGASRSRSTAMRQMSKPRDRYSRSSRRRTSTSVKAMSNAALPGGRAGVAGRRRGDCHLRSANARLVPCRNRRAGSPVGSLINAHAPGERGARRLVHTSYRRLAIPDAATSRVGKDVGRAAIGQRDHSGVGRLPARERARLFEQ